jgi:glycerol kinase
MASFIAALDQGTTSTRCIIFDREANIVSVSQKEHRQIYPRPGWVEHDAAEIWANAQAVILKAVRSAKIKAGDLAAIGITNQRETTVAWDRKTGMPLYNAIVWQDTRTDKICSILAAEGGQDRFRAKTGLPLATYFSGPKIKWILDNSAQVRKATKSGNAIFGTMDSWLIWNLTGGLKGGVHSTDVTNASRTLLMNLKNLEWDDEILSALGIPRFLLPKICPSAHHFGVLPKSGFLNAELQVSGALGDQQAALVGQNCFAVGEAKNTYGTGCFLLLNTGQKPISSQNGLLTTVGYKLGADKTVYALEGSVAIAGALVQWLRDNLKIIKSAPEVEALAASVPDNGDVYIVPAFSGLYAPYWRANARGVIAGLTRFANRGHIARAALEATAYQTREMIEAMQRDGGKKLKTLKVDGGMVTNELLMQFQADVLGVPVIRPRVTETTALGAAYVAGLAVGFWKDLAQLRQNWKGDKTWLPKAKLAERENKYRQWLKAVSKSFDWVE